jgi:hypothetical protein
MRVNYNPEISLGSVLQIIAIIGSVFSAYIALKTTDIELAQRIQQHDAQILDMKEDQKMHNEKAYLEIKELGISIKSLDMRVTQFMLDQSKELRSMANESRTKR